MVRRVRREVSRSGASCQLPQAFQRHPRRRLVMRKLPAIAPAELVPALRVVALPAAKHFARRDLLDPFVDTGPLALDTRAPNTR